MNSKNDLFELLPAVYRQQDAEQGSPLKALLQIIAEQVDVVEDDISQLYENWFIETCQDWVVPYIGELIGYSPVHEAGEPNLTSDKEQQPNKILISRREVANTIRYRRRKGTLALLEELAARCFRMAGACCRVLRTSWLDSGYKPSKTFARKNNRCTFGQCSGVH